MPYPLAERYLILLQERFGETLREGGVLAAEVLQSGSVEIKKAASVAHGGEEETQP